jgi:hypothetical protein
MGLIHDIPTVAELFQRIEKEAMGTVKNLSRVTIHASNQARL